MQTTWYQLRSIDRTRAWELYPSVRRFLNMGFELEPLYHGDGKLGLVSQNQKLRVDPLTGDFEQVNDRCVLLAS